MIAGAVLAGGRSRRFGSEKAAAIVDGAPMASRVLKVLAAGCGPLAVNAPDGSAAAALARAQGLPVLPDPPDAPDGPLAGVLAGLTWARGVGAATLVTAPCDTPWLPAELVPRLLRGLNGGRAAFATAGGEPQPLCAAWRVDAAPALAEALRDGRHPPVRRLLADWSAAPVEFPDAAAFRNVNTASDLTSPPGRRI